MSRQSVAVVAFDRISPFHLSVPCLVFGQECYDPCAQAFDLRVCAAEPGGCEPRWGSPSRPRPGWKRWPRRRP